MFQIELDVMGVQQVKSDVEAVRRCLQFLAKSRRGRYGPEFRIALRAKDPALHAKLRGNPNGATEQQILAVLRMDMAGAKKGIQIQLMHGRSCGDICDIYDVEAHDKEMEESYKELAKILGAIGADGVTGDGRVIRGVPPKKRKP